MFPSRPISQPVDPSAGLRALVSTPAGGPENLLNDRQLRSWCLHLPRARLARGSDHWGSCVVSPQVLPFEALVTDTGEVTEAGKAYVPPRVLQEALCVISGVPGLEGGITGMPPCPLEPHSSPMAGPRVCSA